MFPTGKTISPLDQNKNVAVFFDSPNVAEAATCIHIGIDSSCNAWTVMFGRTQ